MGVILSETRDGYLFKPDGAPARVIPFSAIVDLQRPAAPQASSTAASTPAAEVPASSEAPGSAAPLEEPAAAPASPAPTAPSERPGEPAGVAPDAAPAPSVASAPAATAKKAPSSNPIPAAKPPAVPRPSLVAYLAGGANGALALDPLLFYPHLSLDGALGTRFVGSEYGFAATTTIALGAAGLSPSLGLAVTRDFKGEGTIYAGLTWPLQSSELCMYFIGQLAPGSAFMVRGALCSDLARSTTHMLLGLGWGFGT